MYLSRRHRPWRASRPYRNRGIRRRNRHRPHRGRYRSRPRYSRNPSCGRDHRHDGSRYRRNRYHRNPYRRNLVPLARRKELISESPGNFRRPTLAATKDFLDEWRGVGIESADDWHMMDGLWDDYTRQVEELDDPRMAEALVRNRYDEAQHYWRPYQEAYNLHQSDPETYPEPELTQPVLGSVEAAREDFRDFGDYSPTSPKQAQNYLYQFLTRNAEKKNARKRDDVRKEPFKWRYREAVIILGAEKVTQMVKDIFKRAGKRAPKYYLPKNLYDDLDSLPAPAAAPTAEPEVVEVVDEDGNEATPAPQYGPEQLAASPFRRNPEKKCEGCGDPIKGYADPVDSNSLSKGYLCKVCSETRDLSWDDQMIDLDADYLVDRDYRGYMGGESPFRRNPNKGNFRSSTDGPRISKASRRARSLMARGFVPAGGRGGNFHRRSRASARAMLGTLASEPHYRADDHMASPFRRNPGWTFKRGKAIPHDREMDEMYHTQKPSSRLRRRHNPYW